MGKELKVTGIEETVTGLQRLGVRTHKRLLAVVRKHAEIIASEAQLNAPVDEGDLESAIKVLEEIKVGRRNVITVGVDQDALGAGYTRWGHRYDRFAHESTYSLGPKSLEKAARLGGSGGLAGRVGPKYLTRALNDSLPELEAELETVRREIKL